MACPRTVANDADGSGERRVQIVRANRVRSRTGTAADMRMQCLDIGVPFGLPTSISCRVTRLPFLNTYRTMCIVPKPEFRRVLEEMREMRLSA